MSHSTNYHDNYTADIKMDAPLHMQAILLPIFGFPSWILCLPPLVWHFYQGNIAAGSLITWITLTNLFNAINPLIWPRDNLLEWWDGHVWCDIHVRLQAGMALGLATSTVMIVRKLAKVMDTRNMTVSSSRSSKLKEKIWEVVWCWGFPLLFIILYYIVQPVRYMLLGITGCLAAYDTSWPSIALSFIWVPIAMTFASYWAGLLIYRLYRYRREFHRLLLARNTTSSRFIRLFIISLFVIALYLPYSIFLLLHLCLVTTDTYTWSRVHDPTRFNTITKIPVHGHVGFQIWAQVASGYLIFVLFGTSTDAHKLYNRMLVAVGAGSIWPRLCVENEEGRASPSSFLAARMWTASMGSKAKTFFTSSSSSATKTVGESELDTCGGMTRNNSLVLECIPHLHNVATEDTLRQHKTLAMTPTSTPIPSASSPTRPSLFTRFFSARSPQQSLVLPLFASSSMTDTPTSSTSTSPSGVHAHVWAAESPATDRVCEVDGVHVVREVHMDCYEKSEAGKEKKGGDEWA